MSGAMGPPPPGVTAAGLLASARAAEAAERSAFAAEAAPEPAPLAAAAGGQQAPEAVAASADVPRKRINSVEDLELFKQSRLCQQLVSFAEELGASIRGVPVGRERLAKASPLVQALVDMLEELERWINDFPPLSQPMRFGNRAFCKWHERLVERGAALLEGVLRQASAAPADAERLAVELAHYLNGSFGDERRIDYGTGHEASFYAILFALAKTGVASKSDAPDLVLVVFERYMRLMRRLQSVYLLEPAGSHGVWGLDDFHALPFLFGSAQLIAMEEEVPTGDVYREHVVKACADRFLYVDAVRQILQTKRGAPFHETSRTLYDISGVPTWQKTHAGLLKMYRAEVLGKYPVIQHFLFGRTLPWPGDG